jgi:hypothetical protein
MRREGDGTREANHHASAYAVIWRVVTAILIAVSGGSMPVILAVAVVATDPPVTLPLLLRLVVALTLLPWLAARLIARACAVTIEIGAAEFALRGRNARLEIPFRSIGRIVPWRLPLPGAGLSLWMRSGQRLSYGLQAADPAVLLAAIADAGRVDAARAAMRHPTLVYAHAKQSARRWHWSHLLFKFPLFGLLPTAVLFNAHQHIAYGGTWGQYYLYGPMPYLVTLAAYWITTTIYLVLYASVWRGLAEGAALFSAWVAPAHAARARRVAEAACRVLYYAGVPLLLAFRFLT